MTSPAWIVCGWFTPDYRVWADKVIASLDVVGAPHDIIERPKLPGGWEANTMAKPLAVRDAMARHPDKVVIFLDVDCEVRGDLSPLAQIVADVAFYVRSRRGRGGSIRFGIRSGTIVIRPTPAARAFVHAWVMLSEAGMVGDVDQDTLMLAVGAVPGLSLATLDARWCATPADVVTDPVILHDSASRDVRKVTRRRRILWRLLRRFQKRPTDPVGAACLS
jgi:hypothetical protein